MHEPAKVTGSGIDPVAAAEQPEARTLFVLDLEIIADRLGFARPLPPVAMDPLGAVGLADPVDLPAPGKTDRRLVG